MEIWLLKNKMADINLFSFGKLSILGVVIFCSALVAINKTTIEGIAFLLIGFLIIVGLADIEKRWIIFKHNNNIK